MMYLRRNMRREGVAGDSSTSSPARANDSVAHIKVGSYYEIDLSSLSQRLPEQLKSIRIVMVSKKTENLVSLRFPSMYSLRSHFDGGGSRMKPERRNSILPALDESHVMESELAGEVLYRRIPPHEISMKRNSWSFWVSATSDMDDSSYKERITWPAYNTRLCSSASRKGSCWSELRLAGIIKWGKRRRVQYLSRHVEDKKNEQGEENCEVKEEEEEEEIGKREEEEEDEIGKREKEEEDDGNETEGTDEGAEKDAKEEINDRQGTHKRKRYGFSGQRAALRGEETDQKKQNQIAVYKKRVTKKFIDRWSVDRYKSAEKNMLKVMKEKNAVFSKPILRSELRLEARKWIGDTGLLDHLLKHMAGKVAPGGQDRFRRRHNADGAMEYWLESSDLINIRKEAGVQDPYWTPPPGWKLGDNPTQDPVCAREIREIREGLAALKREMEKLTSRKQEEDLAMVTTPSSCVTSQNLDHDNLMIPAKEMYTDLLKKKEQIEEQLMIISESLRKMEEDVGWLKSTVESCPNQPDSTETALFLMESPTMTTGDPKEVDKENQITESSQNTKQAASRCKRLQQQQPPQPPEDQDRAVKIERLKSGFRICRPVGSFLWPNMAAATFLSPNRHHEIVIPTIASPYSLSQQPGTRPFLPPSPPLPPPICPVKPLPGKRPVLAPLPFPSPSPETSINLNEAPTNTKAGNKLCSFSTYLPFNSV